MSVIEDIRAGKKDAIKEVYKENVKDVYNFAKSITGNHDTALDATKRTFVILFNNIQKGETPTNIRLSALKIAYDEACRIAMPSTEAINSPYDKEAEEEPTPFVAKDVPEEEPKAVSETAEEAEDESESEAEAVPEEALAEEALPAAEEPLEEESISESDDLDEIETETYFLGGIGSYDRDNDTESDEEEGKSSGLRTFFLIANIVLILILLWFLFGLLQNLGIIPDSVNIGHQWFNDTIYPIF